jgi:hypothetical protein
LIVPGAKCSLENGESSDCPYSCYWVVWVTLKLDSNFAFSFVCFPKVKGRYLSGCDSRVADCPSQKQGKRTRVFEAATGNTGLCFSFGEMVLSLLFNFFSSAEPSDFCRGRRFLGMYAFQA